MTSADAEPPAPLSTAGTRRDFLLDGVLPVAVIGLLVALIYAPALTGWYYLDDFEFMFARPGEHWWQAFFKPNPWVPAYYRPLEASLLSLQQLLVGDQTWPCHLLQWIMHILVAAITYTACRDIGGRRVQAWLAALFVAVAQVAAQAVAGVDTISQVGATLGTLAAAWAMFRTTACLQQPPRLSSGWYILALAGMTFGLLMKETAAAALLILIIMIGIAVLRPGSAGSRASRAGTLVKTSLPILGVFGLYWLARSAIVVGTSQEGRYGLSPRHMLRNLVELFGATFLVTSPHRLLLWWHGNRIMLAVAMLASVVLVLAVLAGLRRNRLVGTALLVGAALCAIAPVAMLMHVSELYAYGALPFLAILIGLALGSSINGRTARLRYAFTGMILLLQAVSARDKVQLMARNGAAARTLFDQTRRIVARAPADARVWLIQPENRTPEYSVLLVHGFRLIWSATKVIPERAGRPDVQLQLMPSNPTSWPANVIGCTLRSGEIVCSSQVSD